MKHYDYAQKLQALWDKAVKLYREGRRGSATYFTPEETVFLESIGATPQEIYDFAEDYATVGEPDFATFAAIHDIRRSYFLEVQKGRRTGRQIDPAKLPAKDSQARGITWLPRIIQKARAKLHGELHPEVMYSCGGDRRFLREHDIHPAEFLRAVWHHDDKPGANKEDLLIDWVEERSKQAKASK